MKRKIIPYETKLTVTLSVHEREIIRDEMLCDPNFGKLAIVDGKRVKVELSLDDIEEIQGFVAAAANHTHDKKLQKNLYRLFEKFQKYLDKYDDQSELSS